MGPNACQLSVKFEAIFVSRYSTIFRPMSVVSISQNLKFRACQLSVENMDDCQ